MKTLTPSTPASSVISSDRDEATLTALTVGLSDFVEEFGDELLAALNQANPPVFDGQPRQEREQVLAGLSRTLFPAQARTVHAVTELLINRGEPAAIVNGEMGCGKTTVGIATAAVLHRTAGYRRTLVLSPPHLVYKWRREILETIPDARVWVLNGPDTLSKLLKLRETLGSPIEGPEFYVLGRVRMRMGFHWQPAFQRRRRQCSEQAVCPDCGRTLTDPDGEPIRPAVLDAEDTRRKCDGCGTPLWTLVRPKGLSATDRSAAVVKALKRIPTIGEVTARRLMKTFGEAFLASMLGDNLYEFINLMDANGQLVFSDRQAQRMERAMANMEFGFGEGGFQASEFVKRYLHLSSSSATCLKTRSTCSSPTRRMSTRTEAPPRAKPWASWRRRPARSCCSPAPSWGATRTTCFSCCFGHCLLG